jgi:hypothetical protein
VQAHQEVVAGPRREACRLHQVAIVAVADEQARPRQQRVGVGDEVLDQGSLAGVPVGVRVHGQGQAGRPVQGGHRLAAQQAARHAAQELEAFGHALEGLAVEQQGRKGPQAGRQGAAHPGRQQLADRGGTVGQQGLADGQGQPPELAEGRLEAGVELSGFDVLLEAAPAAALVVQQGVSDEVGHGGEGDDALVAGPAVLLPEVVEAALVEDEAPDGERRLGQGHARPSVDVFSERIVSGTHAGASEASPGSSNYTCNMGD